MLDYSIGIYTFSKRFELFKNLINKIRKYRPEIPIVCVINGDVGKSMNETYRLDVLKFLSEHKKTYPIMFPEFRGCSKLINTMILHSPTDILFYLQDDVDVVEDFAFDNLERAINENQGQMFKIHSDFSQVVFTKQSMIDIGWMDERYLSFGHEDGDFYYRFIEKYGHMPPRVDVRGFFHTESPIIDGTRGRYSDFNHEFIKTKYKPDGEFGLKGTTFSSPSIKVVQDEPQYVYEQFFLENKHKIN